MKDPYLQLCPVFRKSTQFSKVCTVLLFAILFYKFSVAQPVDMAKLSVHLLLNTNGGSANTADGCMILYSSSFTSALGPEDSYKFTNIDENIAVPCGNTTLSVEGRPTIVDNDTIPLKIWQYRQNNYFLQFSASNFSAALTAVLKDNYLQQDQVIDLTGVTTINYDITTDSASAAPGRFCVVFKPAGTLPLSMLGFSGLQKDNGVQIDWSIATQANADHYEVEKTLDVAVAFAKIATVTPSSKEVSASYQYFDKDLKEGNNYYRVKMIGKGGDVQLSKVIRVAISTRQKGINIYPNPVKGNVIGIQMLNLEKGLYNVRLYNSTGQQVYNTVLNHQGGFATTQIAVNSNLVKGKYTMSIRNDKTAYNRAVIID